MRRDNLLHSYSPLYSNISINNDIYSLLLYSYAITGKQIDDVPGTDKPRRYGKMNRGKTCRGAAILPATWYNE
jgi:hypothetical protein